MKITTKTIGKKTIMTITGLTKKEMSQMENFKHCFPMFNLELLKWDDKKITMEKI
tara:strand:- start:1763 stop:1927 length:165 start_codon:yes stop_codon:yes gene_type:complete